MMYGLMACGLTEWSLSCGHVLHRHGIQGQDALRGLDQFDTGETRLGREPLSGNALMRPMLIDLAEDFDGIGLPGDPLR
jgi:hypothetical protein